MVPCDLFRERIWDELFGLLEPDDSGRLQLHLATCAACQAEMATALAQHKLVAEAARLNVEIPLFAAPEMDGPPSVLSPHRPTERKKRRSRVLPWLATAAAVLLVIGMPVGLYEAGRRHYETAWQAAQDSVRSIIVQREALPLQARAERENLVRTLQAKHLRLQVIGPAAYQLAAANPYRVWVTDLAGAAVDVPLTARLAEQANATVLAPKKTSKGEWLVELPAQLPLAPESTLQLELTVGDHDKAAPVRTPLRILEPAYRTHLATDKPAYRLGDTIYFRSLTLQRFGLTMPRREFTVTYTLADAQGNEFQTLGGLTKDGLGSGAFDFSPNWRAGEYTLTITEAEKRFPPMTRRFRVQPVAESNVGKGEPAARSAPPTPTPLAVEFFPEGGDLVAGVDNRVYFRVRTNSGWPADLQGAIVDSQDREVGRVQTASVEDPAIPSHGVGTFRLQPEPGETYTLRGRSLEGVAVRAPLPPLAASGVALSLPAAIGGPAEPIQLSLQQAGPERRLVVGLFCQGRLVAQEIVTSKTGRTEVQLTPSPCSGVLRVTVFEERDGQLWPLAERLAFRRPKERLGLSVKADKDRFGPGDKVQLDIRSANEQGKLQPAWLLVSAVDQAALWGPRTVAEADPTAYFALTSELERPEDLESTDILLGDSPKAAIALDMFLGTQGWRGFREPLGNRDLVQAKASNRAADPVVPAIVKLDNLEQVQLSYAAELNQADDDLTAAISKRDRELVRAGNERLQAANAIGQELEAYTGRAAEVLRWSVNLGAFVLFATACILLAIALVRLARGLAGSRPYLAGSLAALLLCAVIIGGPASRWQPTPGSALPGTDRAAERLGRRLDLPALVLGNNRQESPNRVVSSGRWSAGASEKAVVSRPPEQTPNRAAKVPLGPAPRPRLITITPRDAKSPASPLPPVKNNPQLPIRDYAYDGSTATGRELPETILWQPILFADGGRAEVGFALPAKTATYRISVYGHDAAGRLGAVQETVECRQNMTQPVK